MLNESDDPLDVLHIYHVDYHFMYNTAHNTCRNPARSQGLKMSRRRNVQKARIIDNHLPLPLIHYEK